MTLPTRHLLAAALVAALALPAAAIAQDAPAPPPPPPPMPGKPMPPKPMPAADMFAMIDANHDGRITAQEHAAGVQAMFAKLDANHDGKLERPEYAPPPGMGHHGPGMMLVMADADHDGVVTAAEHAAAAKAMFDRMDANHDGRLAGEELHPPMMDRDGDKDWGRGGMSDHAMPHDDDDDDDMPGMAMDHDLDGGDGHHAGMHHDRMRHHAMADMHARLVASMDGNHDGTVTKAEADAGGKALFAKVDADRDGSVTRAEFDAAMRAMHDGPPAKAMR